MKHSVAIILLASGMLAVAQFASAASTALYEDTDFQTGFEVIAPTLPVTIEGNMQWDVSGGPPRWQLAQWDSQSTIFGVAPTNTASGAFVYANADKDITAGGGPAASESDLILSVNAFNEYGGQYRSVGQPWPTLLVQQSISNPNGHLFQSAPSVAQMTSLDFNIDAKLLSDNRNIGPGYNSSIHASQFVHFLTIQNLNPASAGFGDFLWFGTQIYDDREAVTSLQVLPDIGTGKLIYSTGIAPYTSDVVSNGNWVNVNGDLLPRIKAGLQEAWNQGFLPDSQDLSDYYIGGSNMGWEITGLNDASLQIRNLSLTAQTLGLGVGRDGYADRVVVTNAGGAARWAVDASTSTGFGDGVEDAAVLFGLPSDIKMLGDVNGDGLTDKIIVRDDGTGTWLWIADLSTPFTFGDGVADIQKTFGSVAAGHIPHAVGDVDGDGTADRLLVDDSPGFHNTLVDFSTGGTFGDGAVDTNAGFGGTNAELIGVGDLDGDGIVDRVINTAAPGNLNWAGDISLSPGNLGDGSPDPGYSKGFGTAAMVKLIADMNNDGFADRVVVIDPNGTPAWQSDFSVSNGFGDGASDLFQQFAFGSAGDEFLLADILLAPIPGDFDASGFVDGSDLAAWEADFGTLYSGADFLLWQQNLGIGTPLLAAATAVPEPTALTLMALTQALFLVSRHHQKIATRLVPEPK